MKKVLILYTSVGLGHKSIAENIGYYLEQAGYQVSLRDALKEQEGPLVNFGKKLHHQLITNFSFVWKWLYDSVWFTNLTLPWRVKVAAKNSQNIKMAIEAYGPDLVITTQTSPSAAVAYLKSQNLYKGKFGIAFSDFHLHRYWLYEQADFYLANTEEQKEEMISFGIPSEKIFVCGMTLKPKVNVNINEAKKKFNIQETDKVILISSGSLGTGLDGSLISEFIKNPNVKVIAVCGKNREVFEKLNEEFLGSAATILGYHIPMDELYAISNIFITKPGGLSVSEALSWQLPILISHLLPGQEQHNYDYLTEKGWVMPEPINLVSQVLEELKTQSFKNSLKDNPYLVKLFNGTGRITEAVKQALDEV